MILGSDYVKLFLRREGVVILGPKMGNLWLLTAVLVATFLAVAFSNGSLKYLDFKMNDPFINWVEIEKTFDNRCDIRGLVEDLEVNDYLQEQYHINDVQTDFKFYYFFVGSDDSNLQYLSCRFFGDMQTSLVQAILDPGNVVDGCAINDVECLWEDGIGVIVTADAMQRLGYDGNYPAYVDMQTFCDQAESFGLDFYYCGDDRCVRAPLPVLGVVKKLPGNVDVIGSTFFYSQRDWNPDKPFDLAKDEYAKSLLYFIPDDVDFNEFESSVNDALAECVPGISFSSDRSYEETCFKYMLGQGDFMRFIPDSTGFDSSLVGRANSIVLSKYDDYDVHRLYAYKDYYRSTSFSSDSFVSVHFDDLNRIRDFEEYARNEYRVRIEMAQINAKENFNAVRLLANILSWVMIAFAIICIVLFIMNLLQSYFHKVRRNLGTFKAFGISNAELMGIYMIIMTAMTLLSIAVAIVLVGCVQWILPLLGVLKDGAFNYLSLFNSMTVCAVIVILLSSILTAYRVMRRLLVKTPGDLIYDRD